MPNVRFARRGLRAEGCRIFKLQGAGGDPSRKLDEGRAGWSEIAGGVSRRRSLSPGRFSKINRAAASGLARARSAFCLRARRVSARKSTVVGRESPLGSHNSSCANPKRPRATRRGTSLSRDDSQVTSRPRNPFQRETLRSKTSAHGLIAHAEVCDSPRTNEKHNLNIYGRLRTRTCKKKSIELVGNAVTRAGNFLGPNWDPQSIFQTGITRSGWEIGI